jgi:tripartite-type tricarboxylate transporter receptor subunit TctC
VITLRLWTFASIFCVFAGAQVHADTYPTRPIRVIVPFGAGGVSDVAARVLGEKLTKRLGQPIVVENHPGAGGRIGTARVATAAPDGYTLLMASSTELAVNPSLYRNIAYDVQRDFAPVALIASTPLLLVVTPSLAARSVDELVALARSRPGELNYSSTGNGSTTHLAAEMFKRTAGIDLLHVPHKDSSTAVVNVVNGQIELMIASLPASVGQARSGDLRALAVTSKKRSGALPEAPTLAEQGYPDFDLVIWNAVMAPAGTPKEILARLEKEILDVLRLPDVHELFAKQGVEVTRGSADELAALIRSDAAKFANVIKEAGIRVD